MSSTLNDTMGWFEKMGHAFDKLIIEFLGTMFLVLTIGMVSVESSPTSEHMNASVLVLGAFAIGSVLLVLVFMGGHVSGGHYNPAVSLAVFFTGREQMTKSELVKYIIVQLLGGFFGAWTAHGLVDGEFAPRAGASASWMQAAGAEILFTFVLCSTVLNTATTRAQEGNSHYGLGIGFSVFAGGLATGPISGGVLNPAVATSGHLVYMFYNDGDYFKWLPLYWATGVIAALIAAFIFRITNHREYKESGYEESGYRLSEA